MKIKYIQGVTPEVYGIPSSSEEGQIYLYSSDPQWAERMKNRGEKIIPGRIKKTYWVDNLEFSSPEKALEEVRRNLQNMENSSINIEVTTLFLVNESSDSEFTHLEQLKRW